MDERICAVFGIKGWGVAAPLLRGVFTFGVLLVGPWSPVRAQTQAAAETTGGCISAALEECVARVKAVYAMSRDDISDRIKRNQAIDINGNPVVKDPKLILFGKFRADPQQHYQGIIVSYGPDMVVHRIVVSLASSPELAKTQEEYERTGLANAVFLAVGHGCEEAKDPMVIYRFFQNEVKPRLEPSGRDLDADMNEAHDLYRTSMSPIPFCGKSVSYSAVVGNTSDSITLDNPNGVMSSSSISITD